MCLVRHNRCENDRLASRFVSVTVNKGRLHRNPNVSGPHVVIIERPETRHDSREIDMMLATGPLRLVCFGSILDRQTHAGCAAVLKHGS